ncbi:MAG: crotonase/enoyl-CoA hydratase family protein [Rhodospirillales bacterium]|nr:crotonase/enoyl-CoA hydratase family protein [Rhodospirillales bacterium]
MPEQSQPRTPLPASLAIERDGELLIVRLCRPAKRNALNDPTILGLEEVFTTLPAEIKAVVLEGEGEHFSAGLDLAELADYDAVGGIAHSSMWHRVFEKIQFGRVPVVAALKGAVIGGGLELACAAHIRVAERSTYYALPEGQRGLFVGGGGSVRVPRLIGVARMMDMMLTGRTYDSEEGYAIGLAQYLVADGEGAAKARDLARRISGNAPVSNLAVIHALPRIAEADPATGYMTEALMAAIAQSDKDAKGRMREFLEKRGLKVVAPKS